MKKTWKRVAAIALALCMMFNMLVFADTVDDGIEFTKTATVNSDNSVNVHMEAYTTGQVRNTSTTTPTDIILLLDMSGSMDDDSNVTEFVEVKGSSYRYGFLYLYTGYGFNDTDTQYYIKNGEDYVPVSYSTRDDNGFEYYSANGVNYYPILEDGTSTNRENSYDVVQFYIADYKSHMEVLYDGASDFIAHTALKNEAITDPALKHRISIIKFADDSYYNGSEMTSDYTQAVIGNNRQSNGYNYTQVVSDFTVVDDTGKTALTNALGALQAGGATSVDYGMQLAISQFGKRTDAEGRNEVLILFTDGEPNHSSGYSASVAGSSINHAKNLKDTGVVIYSIGGENSADSSQIGDNYNAFMHYMSNNFPSASYSDGTITAGTGDVNGGYYMTATDDKDLSDIFDEILSKINFPTIELGPEARVIDTISEYFHIPDGANSVTLTVADKTASGWGTPYAATGVTATVSGQTLSVSGFDFDANHVSADGRGDNGDFYGRKLIIDVKIAPDYADIDAAGLTDGKMPTNLGAALVVNSNGDTVDTAEPPIVEAKKVTYKVDGVETKHLYRFEGAEVTVDAEPTKVGHTFSGWSQTGTFTMPDADVVISGNFTANEYFVSYTYSGEVPAGATDVLPDTEKYVYGDTVTVADPVSVQGYTFSGWTPRQTGLDVTGGTFSMPANNVEFIGHFVPSTGTAYKIEHYLMDENGQYPTTPTEFENLKGTTGHTATATPLPKYATLYTYDPMKSMPMGVIRSDGSTVLKIYYSRNKFDVVYKYEGDVPSNAPTVPATVSYYHGATVTVDTTPVVVDGYEFVTWHHHATEGEIDIVGGQFTMPTREVTLYGRFTAKTDIPYKVEHYIANADNTGYETTPYQTNDHTGATGETVTAQPITITGFTYNDADSALTKTGVITADGQLVLRLYYNRNKYNVSYAYEGDTEGLTLPTLPTGDSYYYDQTVTVAGKVSIEDYDFHGWYIGTESNIVTDFTMPARDVVLLGHFVPGEATPYTVEHYLMGTDGQYPSIPADTEIFRGTTGHTVTATPLLKYDGFTYDDVKSAATKTGVIGNDLVLKLYYSRNKYNVVYKYEGDIPSNAPAVPATADYYYGATVTVDTTPVVVEGYDFETWHHHATEGEIDIVGGQFVMPMREVTLYGRFTPRTDTKYTVEHYIANADNTGYEATPYQTNNYTGATGETVTAQPITITGFTYNDADSALTKTGVITGDGQLVLKLYYTRNKYNVSYDYEGDTEGLTLPTLPTGDSYYYGQTVDVAGKVSINDYEFHGWYIGTESNMITDFAMPARDVVLLGHFVPNTATPYTVEHYLMGIDGQYPSTPEDAETFKGTTGHTVTATPLLKYEGFTYDDVKSAATKTGVIGNDLVLKLYYSRNRYDVVYQYERTVPTEAEPVPATVSYYHGETVEVADDYVLPGYTFSGWHRHETTVNDSFVMPAETVTLYGYYEAKSDTKYTVEHYIANADNTGYEATPYQTQTLAGTTGAEVTARPVTINGFTYNDADSALTKTGVIKGDGSLVLKLYYNRNKYNVSYDYEGDTEGLALPTLPTGDSYYYGQTVDVADKVSLQDYDFHGWYVGTESNMVTDFTMPARDVVLLGHFVPNTATPYTVEHYLMGTDGQYPSTPEDTETFKGTTGHTVTATPLLKYDGFTYDDVKSAPTKTGVIGNDLVLKLYYSRNRYDVIYQYERTVPTEAEPVPATVSYYHGETVEIADDYTLAGYTFSGWHRHDITVTDSFVMPTADVTVYGYYEAKTDTKYTVEHYIANLDNTTYPDTPYQSQTLTGTSGAEITATPITIDGFTYNDADSALTKTGVIKGDGTLVLKLYYKRNEYTVSYAYEGDTMGFTPPTLPATETYVKGEKVTVAPQVTLQGYVFVGWYFGDVNSPATGTFTMPARNVKLVGHFEPSEDNGYKVSHYLQGLDGQYHIDGYPEYRTGKTGTFVSAVSKVYDGFEFDPTHPDTLTSDNIKADGSLELKFFYNRLSYDVKYVLDGTQPYGVTATVPTDYNTTELYGTSVSVKPDLSQIGYTFSGWTTEDVTVSGGNFDMPAKTVTFKGKFVANTNNHYKVEYYLQKLDNANEYELADFDEITATTGQLVTAEVKHFDGFTPKADNVISAFVAGDGSTVIKIYYDRILYNVEYRYYGEAPSCASALPATKTGVPFGAKLTVEPDAVCTDGNHVFDGWKSPHVTPVNGEYTIPLLPNNARTVVFYGVFEDLHDVIYDLNGGTGADGVDYSTVKYEHGTVVTIKDAPTKARHTFTGWKAENADYQPGDDHTVTADITLVAQWRANGGGGGGSVTPVTRYTLTYESNGGTKYSNELYAEGTVVKLTKVPVKEGFVFDGWHLDEGLTQYVTEVKMDKDITVYAHWVEDNGGAGNGSPTPSVLNGDDHFAYIVGYEDGTLRPENNITRAEVTTIFFRLLKDDVRKDSLTSNNSYTDIPADAWYNTSISTMSAMGIVGGKSAGKFAPGAFITRAEFAVICARFDDSDFEIVDHFGDVAGHWAEAEIHEAAAHGWIKGYEDGTFRPDALITRAEAVTMINRVLNRIPETKADLLANMIIWPDNDENDWFYLAMCEATNSHNFDMKNHVYEKWTSLRENPDWAQYQ